MAHKYVSFKLYTLYKLKVLFQESHKLRTTMMAHMMSHTCLHRKVVNAMLKSLGMEKIFPKGLCSVVV